jgi:hypothetical protein
MKLGELASHISIDPRKLAAYALNPNAPRGRHKALVFDQVLGYNLSNWRELQAQIESLAPEAEACPRGVDQYGHRYVADLLIKGVTGRETIVRTGWIVRPGEDVVRLVTLWIEGK